MGAQQAPRAAELQRQAMATIYWSSEWILREPDLS
jgi:hypothetical protein